MQVVTGLDKSAEERLQLLADFSITINGVFNDASNQSHAVFSTVPSKSSRSGYVVVCRWTLGLLTQ